MKLVIFGASGQTGSLLVSKALESGHQVTAYVRREGVSFPEHPNLSVIVGQLDDTLKLQEAIAGADACLSALGGNSLKKRSAEFTNGIANILSVIEQTGVRRFIYLSSIGAGDSRYYMGPLIRLIVVGILLRIPLADHTDNEKRIPKSTLDWTVVRPTGLTDGSQTSSYRHGADFIKMTGNPKISRTDVAGFMVSQLSDPMYVKKAAWIFG